MTMWKACLFLAFSSTAIVDAFVATPIRYKRSFSSKKPSWNHVVINSAALLPPDDFQSDMDQLIPSDISTSIDQDVGDLPLLQQQQGPSVTTGRLLVLAAAALYGTNFATVKVLDEHMPVQWSAAYRFSIAAAACLALTPSEVWQKKDSLNALLGGAQVGFWYALGYLCQSYGLQTVDADTSAFFNAASVLVVPALDVAIKGSKFTWNQAASLLFAVGGVGLLELGPSASFNFGIGDYLCLGQAFLFGVGYWVLGSVSVKHRDAAEVVTVGQLLSIAFGFLLFAGVGDWPTATEAISWATDPLIVGGILWTGLVSTAMALYLETIALQAVSAAELTIIMASTSIWGSAFAFLTMGELPPPAGIGGGILILIGCLLSAFQKEEEVETVM
eukprot:scaffold421244_cov58-Attheya_sp.AAC.5